jgi:FkbM family methyltransferase
VGCPDAGKLAGVNDEDTSFQHYTLRHRITAWISEYLFGNFVYTSGHGLTKGLRRKGGLGWLPEFLSRSVETEEHRFWLSLDLKGKVVYDVGSFQGLPALYFARTARAVVCYEPNDSNRRRLLENIALNNMRQITVRPIGIGSEPGSATMCYSPLMSGGASVDQLTVWTGKSRPGGSHRQTSSRLTLRVTSWRPLRAPVKPSCSSVLSYFSKCTVKQSGRRKKRSAPLRTF